jgi:hypothetical protein
MGGAGRVGEGTVRACMSFREIGFGEKQCGVEALTCVCICRLSVRRAWGWLRNSAAGRHHSPPRNHSPMRSPTYFDRVVKYPLKLPAHSLKSTLFVDCMENIFGL